jgi:hypothetical protein
MNRLLTNFILAFINFHAFITSALPTVCAAPGHVLPFAVGQGTKTSNNIVQPIMDPETVTCHLFNLKFSLAWLSLLNLHSKLSLH